MIVRDLNRVLQCPGSRALVPDVQRYRTAWEVARDVLDGKSPSCPQEMLDGAKLLQEHVADRTKNDTLVIGATLPVGALGCEVEVLAYSVHAARQIVSVWFYDFGHRRIDAYQNADVAAACEAVREHVGGDHKWWISAYMVQPRCYLRTPSTPLGDGHAQAWSVDCRVSLPDMIGRISRAHTNADKSSALTVTGRECTGCPASGKCEALMRACENALDMTGPNAAVVLPPQELAFQLRNLHAAERLIAARLTGLEAVAMRDIQSGGSVPGWTIERGTGREGWVIPAKDVIAAGAMFGVSLGKEGTLTPNQARAAGMPAEMVAAISERTDGKQKLVEITETAIKRTIPNE